jgi:tetratricopeptide (TPR) repeat protein
MGDPQVALDGFEAAARCFEVAGDVRNALGHLLNVGYAAMQIGAFPRAERALRAVLLQAEGEGLLGLAGAARHNLALTVARLGSIDEALWLGERAVRELMASGDRRLEGGARIYLSTIWLEAGDAARAETEARAAVAVCATIAPSRAHALATLAQALLRGGRLDEGLAVAGDAKRLLDELGGLDEGESRVRLVLAEALAACGRAAEARTAAEEARRHLLARAERVADPQARMSFLHAIPDHSRTLLFQP